MGIGRYRHLVTLDDPAGPLDPPTWACAIQSAGASVGEGIAGQQLRGRFHPGINLETRVQFGARTFQVQSVTDVDEQQIEVILLCAEVVGRHGEPDAVVYPPPTITTPPASSSIAAGESVTLTVIAAGRGPLAYQWLKNGALVAGATQQFYVTGPLTTTTAYAVTVSNRDGAVTSPAATVSVVLPYAQQVTGDGATYYWRLNDTTGSIAMATIGGADGTISGGVTLGVPGPLADGSTAMMFDGTTGKIVTAAIVTLPPSFTLEAWIKIMAAAPSSELPYAMVNFPTGEWFNFKLYPVSGARRPGIQTPFGYAPLSANGIANDVWHHVVWVLANSTAAQCFIDGVAVGVSDAGPGAARTGSTGVCELAYSSGHGTYWPGAIDEVAIYPVALTPAQIAAHYAARTLT